MTGHGGQALRDSGRRTTAGSTTFHGSASAPSSLPSPTTARALDEVDDDDRDVVAAAGIEGQLGQGRRGLVVLLRGEHARDHVVGHQVGEPVAGQQQPVADRHVEPHDVGAAALRVAVDRAEHDVAPRVHGTVLGSQLTGVDRGAGRRCGPW